MQHRKLYNFRVYLTLALCFALLAGCAKGPSSRDQVAEYIRNECGISEFEVNPEPSQMSGQDGCSDYIWTVTEPDGLQFQVYDDYSESSGELRHVMFDNYNAVHLKRFLQGEDCRGFAINEMKGNSFAGVTLSGKFKNRRELRGLVDSLNALAARCPQEVVLTYVLEYDHPNRTIFTSTDSVGDTLNIDKNSGLRGGAKLACDQCEGNMLSLAVDMRYDSVWKDFTEAEIRSFVKDNPWSFGVKQTDGSYKIYDDMLLGKLSCGMSFATAYEVMKRGGYKVSGSPRRFSFKGADGHTYEFSNDFIENRAYYYIKDGKHVPMEPYYSNHLSLEQFKQMTGMECVQYARVQKEMRKP